MLHSGELRGIQIGGRRIWRIGRVDLESYIEEGYGKTSERIASGELEEDGEEVSPQLARALQATDNVWLGMKAEFGLLTSKEVAEAVTPGSRDLASDLRAAAILLQSSGLTATGTRGFRSTAVSRPFDL